MPCAFWICWLTISSIFLSSSGSTGLLCEKSKRSLHSSTSEPLTSAGDGGSSEAPLGKLTEAQIAKGQAILTKLKELHLSLNQLKSLEGLLGLGGLEVLCAADNQIAEVTQDHLKGLGRLDELRLEGNALERLAFLYLITGNIEKLKKMLKIAEMRQDVMGRFHNALFLGDASERTRVLEEAGQSPLAYVTAVSHGMLGEAGRIKELCKVQGAPFQSYCTIHSSCTLRLQSYDRIIGPYSRYRRARFGIHMRSKVNTVTLLITPVPQDGMLTLI